MYFYVIFMKHIVVETNNYGEVRRLQLTQKYPSTKSTNDRAIYVNTKQDHRRAIHGTPGIIIRRRIRKGLVIIY